MELDEVLSTHYLAVGSEPRVLVVDDDRVTTRRITGVLTGAGYDIEVANNGQEAIDLINDGWVPDVILLDLLMPDGDGNRTLLLLKGSRATASIPIIAMSAYAHRLQRARLRGNADDFLAKPLDTVDLVRQVAHALHPIAIGA